MLELGVNAEARRFSEPGAGMPHAGIFGGLMDDCQSYATCSMGLRKHEPTHVVRGGELHEEKRASEKKIQGQKIITFLCRHYLLKENPWKWIKLPNQYPVAVAADYFLTMENPKFSIDIWSPQQVVGLLMERFWHESTATLKGINIIVFPSTPTQFNTRENHPANQYNP